MSATKRALSVLLAIALLAGCLSVFASASGVFKDDEITLNYLQNTNYFKNVVRDYDGALHFTSEKLINVSGTGEVSYSLDDSAYQDAVEYGWDGFMPFSRPWGTTTVHAVNEDGAHVGSVTVHVQPRLWAWILGIVLLPVVGPFAVAIFYIAAWVESLF